MNEAMKPKNIENTGIMKRAARFIAAPLVAGLLMLGCGQSRKNESIEFSGPAAACQKKFECVHLLKKGDSVSKVSDKKSYAMELKIADVDAKGTTFEVNTNYYYKQKETQKVNGKFRINFDGSFEATGILLEMAKNLGIKLGKTPDPNVVKLSFYKQIVESQIIAYQTGNAINAGLLVLDLDQPLLGLTSLENANLNFSYFDGSFKDGARWVSLPGCEMKNSNTKVSYRIEGSQNTLFIASCPVNTSLLPGGSRSVKVTYTPKPESVVEGSSVNLVLK